ncbi:hypothetical protein ACFLUJ_08720, partial [Chloroflexota bacterium]
TLEENLEEPVQLQEETLEENVEEPVQLTQELDREAPYIGEVELEIAVPVEANMVYKLYDYLQTISDLRILHTRGSWDRGTTIAIAIDQPIPLISIISNIPGIEVTPELYQKGTLPEGISGSVLGTRRKAVKRIKLFLKAA